MTWQKFDQPASRPHGTNRIPSGVRDRGEASSKRPKRTGLVTAIVTAVAGVVVSAVVAALRLRR